MPHAEWGADPEFFGPRHAHREGRILDALRRAAPAPGPHLECAAGVGSLSHSIAAGGRLVVAADTSLRSLAWMARQRRPGATGGPVVAVLADIQQLPFADGTFTSVTSAETLEHIPDDHAAVAELVRCLRPGGWLVGTVPAGPEQWSDWDNWAGHERRYTVAGMSRLLRSAGLQAEVRQWGWPVLRTYDELFLQRINRRRLHASGGVDDDPALRTVQGLGRQRWLVRAVRSAFSLDRLFDGTRWGVGLLFAARRSTDQA
jgi:ubiquinone/menaquinone biosynthesis C-methylase UbiE